MDAQTERRPLPPSRDPDQRIRPGNTPREGPPLRSADQEGQGLNWVVLRCNYEGKFEES
jgi:hypothetical protein